MGLFGWLFGKKKRENEIKAYFDLYDSNDTKAKDAASGETDDGQSKFFKDSFEQTKKEPAVKSAVKAKAEKSSGTDEKQTAVPVSAEKVNEESGESSARGTDTPKRRGKASVKSPSKPKSAVSDSADSSEKIADDNEAKADFIKESAAAVDGQDRSTPEQESSDKKSSSTRKTGRFEIKKTRDGRFVFNLYAPNSVIVATSQTYSSSQSAINGIESIIANAHKAEIEDQTAKSYAVKLYPKWELYTDNAGQYRFRLNAPNGNCIVHSQGYTTKASCKNGIESIRRCSVNPEIDKSYLKKQSRE